VQNFDAAKLRTPETVTILTSLYKTWSLTNVCQKSPPLDSIISYKTHSTLFTEHSPLYKASNSPASPENSCIL